MNFNTTLVTVYPKEAELKKFIPIFQYNSCYCLSTLTGEIKIPGSEFQYNSCYCLSLWLAKISITPKNFNTTLVTVYHGASRMDDGGLEFQYNSCYCLSNAFKPFFHFIIASFPDKINVSLNISQPSSIFSHFSPIHLQMAISRGLYAIINFIGWEISIPYRAERATRRVWNTVCPLVWHFDQFSGLLSQRCKASKLVKMDVISTG